MCNWAEILGPVVAREFAETEWPETSGTTLSDVGIKYPASAAAAHATLANTYQWKISDAGQE